MIIYWSLYWGSLTTMRDLQVRSSRLTDSQEADGPKGWLRAEEDRPNNPHLIRLFHEKSLSLLFRFFGLGSTRDVPHSQTPTF